MPLSKKTRQDIFDWLSVEQILWAGRLEEPQFLARLYDLDEIPSRDPRFSTVEGDIRQHRGWEDWPLEWVFTDSRFDLMGAPDEEVLLFLAEMLHPIVRPDTNEARGLAATVNEFLRRDGYELVPEASLGGKPVWAGRRRSLDGPAGATATRRARAAFDAAYILDQITRMDAAVESDPELAIGTAKELIETVCKAILSARRVALTGREDVPRLVRMTAKELRLRPEDAADGEGDDTVRRMLGSLSTLAGSVAELRNDFGTGHGRDPGTPRPDTRHAKLAAGAAATLAVFLWETHAVEES